MTSFKDRAFGQRLGEMGDRAEGAFEDWCKDNEKNYVRWGLDRPPLNLGMIPTRLRYSPDYLMSRHFVECQGFGQDRTFKLKVEKHGALRWWNDLHPVVFWVLDSHLHRACFLSLDQFDALIGTEATTLGAFREGKAYFAVNGDNIFLAAGTQYAAQT